jgi:DNA polymerase III subunit epsilon
MRVLRLRRGRSAAAVAYRRAKRARRRTPWRDAHFAAVDLETTGLDPNRDEIISFALIPIDDGRVVVGAVRTGLIRPVRMPEAETIRIHGLRPVDLADAPPLAEAIDGIVEFLTGRVVVAHSAWVERGFLNRALKLARLRVVEPVLDTAVLTQRVLTDGDPNPDWARLGDAARALGLPVHRPHHADGDALTTAQLFIALAARLDRVEPQTVGSLARLSRT